MAKKFSDKQFRLLVYNKCNGRCAYCGCNLLINSFQIDHVEPKRRGMNDTKHGCDEFYNLLPSCRPCNYSKGSMDAEKWRKELLLKIPRLSRDSSIYRMALKFNLIEERIKPIIFYFETLNNG